MCSAALSHNYLRRYVEFITRHPKPVVAFILAVSLALSLGIPKIYIENERKQQLPGDNPIIQLDDEILRVFGGGKFTLVGLEPLEGDVFQPWVLEKVRKITEGLQGLPGVEPGQVLSLTSSKVKSIEAGPEGEILVRRLIDEIPSTPEGMAALRERVLSQKLLTGFLVAPGGKATAIVADFDDLDPNPELYPSVLDRRIHEIVDPLREPRVKVFVAGMPIFVATMDKYTRNVLKLFFLAVVVIGLVHYEAFRTFQAMFLPLVTALLSVVWGLGIFCHLHVPMDGWNALSPFLILAVAAGHAVQILKRYYEEYRRLGDNRAAVVESTVSVGTVMITAGLIAAAGLLTLTLFPIRSIQVFGLLSASGILSALVIEMSFIPACRALLPAPRLKEMTAERHGGVLERVLELIARAIITRPWLPLVLCGAVLAAALFGASRIEVENSFRQAMPGDEQTLLDYDSLNNLFGGVVTLNILVEGEGPDALYDPRLLGAIEGMQRFLESRPGIGRTLSIVDYIKQMNVAFNDGRESYRRLPDSRETVAQYFLLYSGDPDDFDMMVDADYRRAVIRAYAETDGAKMCERLFQEARGYAEQHFPPHVRVAVAGGGLAIGKAINDTVLREKIRNAAVIVTIIFIFSSLVLRSLVGGLLVLTPSLLAAIVNLGIMGFVGTWLNLATAAISSLTVSIGADYAIYFIFRFREEYRRTQDIREATLTTMLTSGKAIFFVASAIAFGSLVMAISPLSYHKQLGGYVAASMFTASLAAVTVIPSIVILLKPKFLRRTRGNEKPPQA